MVSILFADQLLMVLVAVLLMCENVLIFNALAQPTPAPTGRVGTADAPTTPGGTCLNDDDLELWRSEDSNGKNGFDYFPIDLQACSVRCGVYIESRQSVEYTCGGLFQENCPTDLYAVCVRDCMSRDERLTSRSNFPNLLTSGPYSFFCASCMGNVSYCVTENCFTPCVQGGNDIPACKDCAEDKCNPVFQKCAGLNINQIRDSEIDFTPIIIGAVAGGLGLLLSVGVIGYRYRMKTRKLAELSPEEMSRLAYMQRSSKASSAFSGFGGPQTRSQGNPLYANGQQGSMGMAFVRPQTPHSSFGSSGLSNDGTSTVGPIVPVVQLTPYQMQYEAQVRQYASNLPREKPRPSARMSLMASTPLPSSALNGGTPIMMLWAFRGERPDEMNVEVGEKLIGIEQADGWWLAMSPIDKRVGLVPVNYTTHDPSSIAKQRPNPTRNIPPSARMSRMHASLATTPSVKVLQMPATPLIAIFDFEAQRPDEITVHVGTIVLGIHEQDGWWLVRTEQNNKIGLVPSNFLEKLMITTPGTSSAPSESIRNGGEPNF